MNTSEFVELAALVVTIISTLVVPFLQRPILSYTDPYDLSNSNNTTKIGMTVSNQGLAPAENVVISLSANDVKFNNFSFKPIIPNSSATNNTIDYQLIQMGSLASGQSIAVEGYLHSNATQPHWWYITPSVFFKTSVAYTQDHIRLVQTLMAVFATVATILLIHLFWRYYYRKQTVKEYDYTIKLIE
jgi:hypothetical protein